MADYLTEEDQVERFKRWMKTYGGALVTGILIALIAYFGWSYWQKTQHAEQSIVSAEYQQLQDAYTAAVQAPDDAALKTEFLSSSDRLVKANPDSAYALHSLLLQARAAVDREDYPAAAQALQKAAAQKVDDVGLTQLVQLRLARVQAQQNQLDAALATLAKVTDPAFAPSAQELKGDLLFQKNQLEPAKVAYQAAWDALAKREEPRELLRVKMEAIGMTVKEIKVDSPVSDDGANS